MTDQTPDKPLNLVQELRRRKVLYTAVMYGVSAFAVTEMAAFLFENFGAPDWANRLLAALFVAGFPVAMFLAWVFDISADGIVRSASGDPRNRRGKIGLALGLLVISTGLLFYLIFPEPEVPSVSRSAPSADYEFEPAEKLENSVAVLPFDSLSSEPDDAFFSRGVAEEILNHLGTYRELNIIGRTSSFVFEAGEIPAPRISALLGARYLLQGSVRRAGKQIRVSTQLLDENGLQVWSRNFDRQLEDIFDIQTQIAVSVAEEVVSMVSSRPAEPVPTRIDVYELFLKGRELVYTRIRGEEAIELLQQAIELDPDYAPAHAELAVALALEDPALLDSARAAAETALSLRPGLLRAEAAKGLIAIQQDPPDPVAAQTALQGVLAQEPNMIDASLWLANALNVQGKVDQATETMQRAIRLDPLHPTLSRNLVNWLTQRGEDRRAEAIARRVIESPNNASWHPYVALSDLYQSRGRLADAVRIARKWTEDSARAEQLENVCYCLLISAHDALGDEAAADYWLARSKVDFPGSRWNEIFSKNQLEIRGRFDEARKYWLEFLLRNYGLVERAPAEARIQLGILEALSQDHEAAIETMEPLLDAPDTSGDEGLNFKQALAWAYLETGREEPAALLLDKLEKEFNAIQEEGTLLFRWGVPYFYALNGALRNDENAALDRLETIIDAGWKNYYDRRNDPRWGALHDHPRFQSLMARAQAEADRQRSELEASEPGDEFIARLDAVITASSDGAQ